MSSSLSPSQMCYRPSYASDVATAFARSPLLTPARGDAAESVANFHSWNSAEEVGPYETVAGQHESMHRNYESRILRVSASVATPTCPATLVEDRRGATGSKLPQGCCSYISHEGWKSTAPSVLPAYGCALSPLAGQLQQLHNSPVITDSYHLISKSDTTIEDGMFAGISSSSPAYAGPADVYIDLGLAPAGGEYSHRDASFACATTPNQAQTSRRQSTSSTESNIRSPPPSLYRDSSNSPSSIFDELSTPNFGPLEHYMPEQFVSPQNRGLKTCGPVESATVAARHLAYSNILYPEQGIDDGGLAPNINAWLQDQDHYVFAEQQAAAASTSAAQSSQSYVPYALPPAAFMQPQPAAMPDLQHPRPKRAFTPAWQEQTEFDLAEFVKMSPRPAAASSSVQDAAQQDYSYYGVPSYMETVAPESFEEEEEEDYAMDEDDEDWDLEDDVELDQSTMDADPRALLPHSGGAAEPLNAALGMNGGLGMGRGFSTRPLDSQSLLFQPVADYVRCPDLVPAYVPTFTQEYSFTYPSTC